MLGHPEGALLCRIHTRPSFVAALWIWSGPAVPFATSLPRSVLPNPAESCLYGWKSRDLIDRGLKPGTTSNESAELAAAQRRIRELEDEVKILRKAAPAVEKVVSPKTGSSSSPSWSMMALTRRVLVANSRCHAPASTTGAPAHRRHVRYGISG
jgi:hypothetical protein